MSWHRSHQTCHLTIQPKTRRTLSQDTCYSIKRHSWQNIVERSVNTRSCVKKIVKLWRDRFLIRKCRTHSWWWTRKYFDLMMEQCRAGHNFDSTVWNIFSTTLCCIPLNVCYVMFSYVFDCTSLDAWVEYRLGYILDGTSLHTFWRVRRSIRFRQYIEKYLLHGTDRIRSRQCIEMYLSDPAA